MDAAASSPEPLRETPVDQTARLPTGTGPRRRFSPTQLFVDTAFAARMWFFVACGAVVVCLLEPYLIVGAYRTKERVVVLDGSGTFSVSPLLGFQDAKGLHEAMALWATLAFFQRNPTGFDYPELLQKIFLVDAAAKAEDDREKTGAEFKLKNIHQKPEVFKIDILQTREDRVLVRVQGQLIRTGVFDGQAFTESPKFTLDLSFARNPDMLANKRYPLGVWRYDYTIF